MHEPGRWTFSPITMYSYAGAPSRLLCLMVMESPACIGMRVPALSASLVMTPLSAVRKQVFGSGQETSPLMKPVLPWFCSSMSSTISMVETTSSATAFCQRLRCTARYMGMPMAMDRMIVISAARVRILTRYRACVCSSGSCSMRSTTRVPTGPIGRSGVVCSIGSYVEIMET